MAAYEEEAVKLPKRVIGQAITMAWLGFADDINDAADKRWEQRVRSLEREIKDLKDALKEERDNADNFLKRNTKSQNPLSMSSRC
jgi:molecular chaperone GrpE (heat shock protein)